MTNAAVRAMDTSPTFWSNRTAARACSWTLELDAIELLIGIRRGRSDFETTGFGLD